MKHLLLTILLASAVASRADSLLVLIDATSRANLGALLPEWVAQVRSEGRWTRVEVREMQRLATFGGTAASRWAALAAMSNAVAQEAPDDVQIIGPLASEVGGWHNVDGHSVRCWESDAHLQVTNWSFTDTLDHGMSGADALHSNVPGDGRRDEITATGFRRAVARIDAANLLDSSSPTIGTGCLIGLKETPAIAEATAISNYFRANLDYRRGGWGLSTTGIVTGVTWNATDRATYAAANSAVTWIQAGSAIGGGARVRYFMHSWANSELNNLYNGSCEPMRCLVAVANRSYGFVRYDIQGYGAPQTRWLFPGRQATPYALVAVWDEGNTDSGKVPFWRASNSDTHVADMHRTSYAAKGHWPLFCTMLGDLTLPFTPVAGAPRTARATTVSVGTVSVQ